MDGVTRDVDDASTATPIFESLLVEHGLTWTEDRDVPAAPSGTTRDGTAGWFEPNTVSPN
ncbi:hypothetical protein [Actinophytocola oryzae]|uniref:Uncharacterized protein n=1 Tax=Actinophytocola oryzae TaxID=502181 RepID=A0A4R7VFB8_9PSEU|nr:hypothetical protein [Actinophytocola oryzae]TDV47934.1 hypothetical protein CLV71_109169 [Actinophytocola oryzae]